METSFVTSPAPTPPMLPVRPGRDRAHAGASSAPPSWRCRTGPRS